MAHPSSRADRRDTRRRFIARRVRGWDMWTRCTCGDISLGFWSRSSVENWHWYQTRSLVCWACQYYLGSPRWLGKLNKSRLVSNPNYEKDWFLSGVTRSAYRQGGGRRDREWGMKAHRIAGRFHLDQALKEWEEQGDVVIHPPVPSGDL